MDNSYIYLKLVKEKLDKKDKEDNHIKQIKFKVAPLGWQRDVGETTLSSRKTNNLEMALENRVSSHMKLFTDILSVDSSVIVAHRNFIHIFDLFNKQNPTGTGQARLKRFYQFKESIRFVSHAYPDLSKKRDDYLFTDVYFGEQENKISGDPKKNEDFKSLYKKCYSYLLLVIG